MDGNMDRKKWLSTVYREANVFLERHSPEGQTLSPTEIDEMEPELHGQVQEILAQTDSLEDIIKHSLLKDPSPDLWYGEGSWQRVLAGVAAACLAHDVKGVAIKISEGALPRTDSSKLMDPAE